METGQHASAPWTAEITYLGTEFCTGSLIAPQWVLTAGHCFNGGIAGYLHSLLRFDHVLVDKGSYGISEAVPEPGFGGSANKPSYDAELLKLSAPVPNASPIALAPPQPDYSPLAGHPVIDAYGDGQTAPGNAYSVGRGMARTKPNSYTIQGLCPAPQTDWCFGWNRGGSEILQGDSGGPWVIEPGAQLPDQGTLSLNPMQLGVTSAEAYHVQALAADLTSNVTYNWVSKTAGTYLAANGKCVYNAKTECIVQFPNGDDYLVGPTSGTGTIGAGFGHLIDPGCLTPLLNTLPGIPQLTVNAPESDEVPLDSTHALCIITPDDLPNGTAGTAYDTTLAADGGTMPYTWAATSGSLPAGLSLDASTGKIYGSPTSAGNFTFAVTATDTNGNTATANLDLTVTGASGTYPISFTASVNVPDYFQAPIAANAGAEITVTGVEDGDCNSPSYTQSYCSYEFTGATGTLYGNEQGGTYSQCSASAQEALSEVAQAGGLLGSVELGSPPDGNGGIGIELEAGAPDRTDIDGGCLAEVDVGSQGDSWESSAALSSPWVPGSQTSSWTVYSDSGFSYGTVAGTITLNWQY